MCYPHSIFIPQLYNGVGVDSACQGDRMQNHLADKPLDMLGRGVLD